MLSLLKSHIFSLLNLLIFQRYKLIELAQDSQKLIEIGGFRTYDFRMTRKLPRLVGFESTASEQSKNCREWRDSNLQTHRSTA